MTRVDVVNNHGQALSLQVGESELADLHRQADRGDLKSVTVPAAPAVGKSRRTRKS